MTSIEFQLIYDAESIPEILHKIILKNSKQHAAQTTSNYVPSMSKFCVAIQRPDGKLLHSKHAA
jgi:hypothetical protein